MAKQRPKPADELGRAPSQKLKGGGEEEVSHLKSFDKKRSRGVNGFSILFWQDGGHSPMTHKWNLWEELQAAVHRLVSVTI